MAFILTGLAFLLEEAFAVGVATEVAEIAIGFETELLAEGTAETLALATETTEAILTTEEGIASGLVGELPSGVFSTEAGILTEEQIGMIGFEDVLGPGAEILPGLEGAIEESAEIEFQGIVTRAEQNVVLQEVAEAGGVLPDAVFPEMDTGLLPGMSLEAVEAGEGFTLDTANNVWRSSPMFEGGFTPEEVVKSLSDLATVATAVAGVNTTVQSLINEYERMRIPNPKTTEVIHRDGEIVDPWKLGYDLGTFMSVSESYMSKGSNDMDAFVKTVNDRPELVYLLKPVYSFEHNSEQMSVDEFLDGVSEYNGKSLSLDSRYSKVVDGVELFCFTDELGSEVCYTGTRGSIPPVWGTYCGPLSYNNTPAVDLLDLFCHGHDQDFEELGFFSQHADAKLLNRIRNNLDRMEPNERKMAKAIFLYFSTIGYSLSILKTKFLPSNVDRVTTKTVVNDIFFQLSGSQSGSARMRFYQGLRRGLTDNFRISGIMEPQKPLMETECRNKLMDLQILWIK